MERSLHRVQLNLLRLHRFPRHHPLLPSHHPIPFQLPPRTLQQRVRDSGNNAVARVGVDQRVASKRVYARLPMSGILNAFHQTSHWILLMQTPSVLRCISNVLAKPITDQPVARVGVYVNSLMNITPSVYQGNRLLLRLLRLHQVLFLRLSVEGSATNAP